MLLETVIKCFFIQNIQDHIVFNNCFYYEFLILMIHFFGLIFFSKISLMNKKTVVILLQVKNVIQSNRETLRAFNNPLRSSSRLLPLHKKCLAYLWFIKRLGRLRNGYTGI